VCYHRCLRAFHTCVAPVRDGVRCRPICLPPMPSCLHAYIYRGEGGGVVMVLLVTGCIYIVARRGRRLGGVLYISSWLIYIIRKLIGRGGRYRWVVFIFLSAFIYRGKGEGGGWLGVVRVLVVTGRDPPIQPVSNFSPGTPFSPINLIFYFCRLPPLILLLLYPPFEHVSNFSPGDTFPPINLIFNFCRLPPLILMLLYPPIQPVSNFSPGTPFSPINLILYFCRLPPLILLLLTPLLSLFPIFRLAPLFPLSTFLFPCAPPPPTRPLLPFHCVSIPLTPSLGFYSFSFPPYPIKSLCVLIPNALSSRTDCLSCVPCGVVAIGDRRRGT
jgi:hypothetical protein